MGEVGDVVKEGTSDWSCSWRFSALQREIMRNKGAYHIRQMREKPKSGSYQGCLGSGLKIGNRPHQSDRLSEGTWTFVQLTHIVGVNRSIISGRRSEVSRRESTIIQLTPCQAATARDALTKYAGLTR